MSAPANTARARPANGQPQPIAFPKREQVEQLCRTRANADNARWQQQVERRDALILAAAAAGRQEGERAGYTAGWHWGAACGVIAGGSAVGALWVLWAPVQAVIAGWLA
jgi:hypothetical protein